jgi:hypothetical protein
MIGTRLAFVNQTVALIRTDESGDFMSVSDRFSPPEVLLTTELKYHPFRLEAPLSLKPEAEAV